jgi:hypothetical protein
MKEIYKACWAIYNLARVYCINHPLAGDGANEALRIAYNGELQVDTHQDLSREWQMYTLPLAHCSWDKSLRSPAGLLPCGSLGLPVARLGKERRRLLNSVQDGVSKSNGDVMSICQKVAV